MADNTKWTDEQERELKERWAARDSCAVIGRALGLTRCAVAGKIRRLGITRAHTHPKAWVGNVQPTYDRPRPRLKPPEAPQTAPEPPYDGPVATASLLAHRGCRFITSGDSPFMHCNREGFPWCSEHRAKVYRRAGAVEA